MAQFMCRRALRQAKTAGGRQFSFPLRPKDQPVTGYFRRRAVPRTKAERITALLCKLDRLLRPTPPRPVDSLREKGHNRRMDLSRSHPLMAQRRRNAYLRRKKRVPIHRFRPLSPKARIQRFLKQQRGQEHGPPGMLQPFRPMNHAPQLDQPINTGPNLSN